MASPRLKACTTATLPAGLALAALLLSGPAASAANTCQDLTADLGRARQARDLNRAVALFDRAKQQGTCSLYCPGRQVALAHVDAAHAASDRRESLAAVEATLRAGYRFGKPWQLLATLGEVRFEQARSANARETFAEAAKLYQQALTALADKEDENCAEPNPDPRQIASLHRTMTEAVLLAPPVEPVSRRDGECGGAFLGSIRGFAPTARPVPIPFDYNKATLTPDGEKAAQVLAECVKTNHYKKIELYGHTDQRGTDAYNMDLSARRLATVRDYLKVAGFAGTIVIVPRGKTEPFRPDDPGKYTPDQRDQLDRRVELRDSQK